LVLIFFCRELLKAASDSEEEEEEQEDDSGDEGSDSGSESEQEKESPGKKMKKTDSPIPITKRESPKIENSPQQAKNAPSKASAPAQQSAGKEGNALADIGNQKKGSRSLADWSDDE
jgi:hypothetical protein